MIQTVTGRPSRIVVSQLWLVGGQAVNLLGWMLALVPPTVAPWVAGVLGTIQAVSAIVLRQSTTEAMAAEPVAPADRAVETTKVDP